MRTLKMYITYDVCGYLLVRPGGILLCRRDAPAVCIVVDRDTLIGMMMSIGQWKQWVESGMPRFPMHAHRNAGRPIQSLRDAFAERSRKKTVVFKKPVVFKKNVVEKKNVVFNNNPFFEKKKRCF